ncbi:MAG: hypothetical protein KA128_15210, partial [Zoogloea sp.]|nr:hypothetical protein [Zoogloea sp.]
MIVGIVGCRYGERAMRVHRLARRQGCRIHGFYLSWGVRGPIVRLSIFKVILIPDSSQVPLAFYCASHKNGAVHTEIPFLDRHLHQLGIANLG